jgi:hypothetical protein
MAGPKERKKLTKPGGFTYAQAKIFNKISNWQTKKGIPVVSLAEYIGKGMPSFSEYEKIYSKHEKMADKILKQRKKSMQKAKVKSIQRKLKKKD